MRPFAIAAFLLLLIAVTAFADATKPSIGPEPSWVKVLPTAEMLRHAPVVARGNLHAVLIDEQINRAISPPETYSRFATRALNEQGVPLISQISCTFNPAYETLQMHRVVIHRGAEDLPVAIAGRIKLLDRGERLGEQVYDGRTTAVLMLDDVRPGDIVDYSYTVRGANPVLAGQFSTSWTTIAGNSVGTVHDRLLWPASRPLRVHPSATTPAPTVTQRSEITEYVLRLNDTPTREIEESVPGWYDPGASIRLDDDTDWNSVARWATTLFNVPEKPSPAVLAKVDEFTQGSANSETRAMAAIRFVQDEIRYLGIEIGENSHRATDPGVVLARRYGDCKDKALLLVTFLRQLGYAAEPALVNTVRRDSTGSFGASAAEFDHVIVRVHDPAGGPGWWVDATASGQRGVRLGQLALPRFGVALVVSDTTRGLTRVTAETEPSLITIDKHLVAKDVTAPATLEVVLTFSGGAANRMRVELRGMQPRDNLKLHLEAYQRLYPKIASAGLPVVTDDDSANQFRVEERFTIPEFWKKRSGDSAPVGDASAIELVSAIPSWRGETRSMPLELSHVGKIVCTTTIELAQYLPINLPPTKIEVGSLRQQTWTFYEGKRLKSIKQMEFGGGFVPAAEAPLASKQFAAMQANLALVITMPPGSGSPFAAGPPDPLGLALALMALALGSALAVMFYRSPDPAIPSLITDPVADTLAWNPGQPIGGWLYVLGIQILATPFFLLVRTAKALGQAGATATPAAGIPAWAHGLTLFVTVLSTLQCVAAILLVVLFLQRRRKFVPFCRGFMAAAIVGLVLDSVRPLWAEGDTEIFLLIVGFVLIGVGVAFAWSVYLRKSRRVEATFVQ